MQLYDKQGNPVDVPEEEVPAKLASGEYGVPKDASVPVFSPDGQLGTVPGDKLHEATGAGYSVAPPAAVARAKRQAEYGGVGGAATAATLEGLGNLTLGASDVAGAALGGSHFDEARQAYREANPTATTVGGLIGAAAPIVLSGGAAAPEEAALTGGRLLAGGAEAAEAGKGLLGAAGGAARTAGRVLGAPAAAVSRAGSGVERVVAAALGADDTTSLVTGLAKRAIAKGAGAATEGAMIGVGQQLGEDAIGDPDTNGEKLYASGLHGALLGLGAGFGLTAAGELGSAILGRAAPKLAGMAEEQAVRTLDPRKAFVKELDRIPGGVRAAGRQMLDDEILRAGDSVETAAPRISAARTEAGEKVSGILETADQAGHEGPRVAELRQKVQAEVLAPLEKLPKANAGAIAKVHAILDDLDSFAGIPAKSELHSIADAERYATQLEHAGLTFRQAQDFRGTLGKSIEWRAPALGPVDKANEAAKDVYRLVEGSVEQSGEKAAKAMGGSFLDEYKQAKVAYQRYTVLDKAAQDALAARAANRIVSPSDYGVGSAVAAGALAHAAAGPAGAILAGAKGLAASFVHHAVRERGNSAAAVLLDKLSALRGVERAAKAVDREMDRGIAGILKEPGRAAPRVRSLPDERQPYRAHSEAALRASANIEAHGQLASAAAAPLAPHAPKTAQAFQSVAVRAAQYLASKAPHRNAPPTIMPHLDEPRVSQTDEKKFMLVAHAVHDPVSVLHDMSEGRATRAQIDALKEVYPKLYGELLTKLQERLADRRAPLAYEQRKQLALLFGGAADPAAAPAFVSRMQQDFGPAPGGGGGPKGPPRGGGPKRKLAGQSDSIRLPA